MFASISINEENKGKPCIYKNYSQYEFGRNEWQQDYNTIHHTDFKNKDVEIFKIVKR